MPKHKVEEANEFPWVTVGVFMPIVKLSGKDLLVTKDLLPLVLEMMERN